MADDAAAAGLQSLARFMARVQRAAAHAERQGDTSLHTLRTHEADVSCPSASKLPCIPPAKRFLSLPQMHRAHAHCQGDCHGTFIPQASMNLTWAACKLPSQRPPATTPFYWLECSMLMPKPVTRGGTSLHALCPHGSDLSCNVCKSLEPC